MSEPDLIDDATARLVAAGLDREIVRRVLSEVRRRWSGCEVYIRTTDRAATDETIRQGLEAGEPPEAIARRAGVSARTVRRRASSWF